MAARLTACPPNGADNTLKTPEDLEKRLNVTFLGLLPEMADEDIDGKRVKGRKARRIKTELPPELLVHERPASGIAEASAATGGGGGAAAAASQQPTAPGMDGR